MTMNCNDCTTAKRLNACATTLTLGTIPDNDTEVYVYFERTGLSRRTIRLEAMSTGSGVVSVNLTGDDVDFLNTHHCYVVYVTLRTLGPGNRLMLTVDDGADGKTDDCFSLEFIDVFDNAGDRVSLSAQTLNV